MELEKNSKSTSEIEKETRKRGRNGWAVRLSVLLRCINAGRALKQTSGKFHTILWREVCFLQVLQAQAVNSTWLFFFQTVSLKTAARSKPDVQYMKSVLCIDFLSSRWGVDTHRSLAVITLHLPAWSAMKQNNKLVSLKELAGSCTLTTAGNLQE